jgi:hypothetical protein
MLISSKSAITSLYLSLCVVDPVTMNFDDFERPAWGVVSPQEGDMGLVRDTVRKEQAIRWVYLCIMLSLLTCAFREILACQEDLKGSLISKPPLF